MPFLEKSIESMDVERRNYYSKEGSWDDGVNNMFHMKQTDRGDETYFVRSRDKITLSTGWLDESEQLLYKEVIKSNDIYISYGDGTIKPVQLEESGIPEIKTTENNDLVNYIVTAINSKDQIKY
jgi:hypothetical protein